MDSGIDVERMQYGTVESQHTVYAFNTKCSLFHEIKIPIRALSISFVFFIINCY